MYVFHFSFSVGNSFSLFPRIIINHLLKLTECRGEDIRCLVKSVANVRLSTMKTHHKEIWKDQTKIGKKLKKNFSGLKTKIGEKMKTTSGSVTEEGGGKRGLDSQQMKKVGGGIRPACGERVQMRVRNFVGYGLLHQIQHRRAGRVAGGRCSGDAGIRRDGCSPDRTKRGFFETCKKGRRENRF